jgi:hypothetical protein
MAVGREASANRFGNRRLVLDDEDAQGPPPNGL